MINLIGNGILLSDIHLSDDERYSPEKYYRTRTQPLMLLKRVKEEVEKRGVKWIAILGDIVDVPTTRPLVTHVLDIFFKELNSFGIPVYFILGQHDVDMNKYDGSSDFFERSNVTVIASNYENLHYSHDKYFTLNNKYKVYMNNFSNPIKYPEEYVDLWLTHCSLGFVKVDEVGEDGKRLFGKMVAGDIHDHLKYGNCYTLGTPYQHKSFEQPQGVIGFINGETLEFERINSDSSTIKFLRFEYNKPEESEETVEVKNEAISMSKEEVISEIKKRIQDLGLGHIHNLIDSNLAPNPVNLDFKLLKLKLENYRSVKDFTLDFSTFKKTLLLTGPFGSGKSSIMYAIKDAFIGDTKTLSKRVNHKAKNCKITLDLEYEGKTYTIIRGKSLFQFFRDGYEVQANTKKDVQAIMERELPFIKYIEYFIPDSNKSLFSKDLGVDLLEICLQLDLFGFFLEEGKKLKKLEEDTQRRFLDDTNILRGEYNTVVSFRDESLNKLLELNKTQTRPTEELEKELSLVRTLYEEVSSLKSEKQLNESKVNDCRINITSDVVQSEIDKLEQLKDCWNLYNLKSVSLKHVQQERLSLLNQYNEQNKLLKEVGTVPQESLEDLLKQRDNVDAMNKSIMQENMEITQKRESLKKELENIQTLKNKVCPTCKQPIKDDTDYDSLYKQKEAELNSLPQLKDTINVSDLIDKIEVYNTIKYNETIQKTINEIVSKGKELKDNIEVLEKELESITPKEEFDQNELNRLKDLREQLVNVDYAKKRLDEINVLLSEKESSLNQITGTPSLYMESLKEEIRLNNSKEDLKNDVEQKEKRIAEYQQRLDDLSDKLEESEKKLNDILSYINLMDYNKLDSLPYSLLNSLLVSFNNDKYMIETAKTLKNGKEKFDISLKIKGNDNEHWIDYLDEASGGQRLLLDLFFYNSISTYVGGIGCFVLDETLNTASVDLYPELNEMISNMKFNNIFIVSHSGNVSCFDRNISVTIDSDGYSVYNN